MRSIKQLVMGLGQVVIQDSFGSPRHNSPKPEQGAEDPVDKKADLAAQAAQFEGSQESVPAEISTQTLLQPKYFATDEKDEYGNIIWEQPGEVIEISDTCDDLCKQVGLGLTYRSNREEFKTDLASRVRSYNSAYDSVSGPNIDWDTIQ